MDKTKQNFDINTIKRLFGYIKQNNRAKLVLVIISIILNTIVTVAGSLYLTVLIDDYIVPLIGTGDSNLSTLIHPILVMIGIYAIRNSNDIYFHKSNGQSITNSTKNYS